jgi:cytochrome c oxidase assembly protein subunit 11
MISAHCSRFILRNNLSLLTSNNRNLIHHPSINPPCRRASTQTTIRLPTRLQPKLPSIKNKSSAYYATAVLIAFLGLTYAAVPIYRLVCQKTGWGGTPMTDSSKFSAEHMIPVSTASGRRIKVSFSASTSDTLPWSFRPQQREISILPGETTLAFYKAKNKSKDDIIGIATYNVSIVIENSDCR